MPYNITGIASNGTTVLGFVQGVNDVLMFGWLGTFFLIGISMVIMFALLVSTQDVKRSLAATSFLTFTLSLFMAAMDLIPNLALYITLILCGIIVATSWKRT